MPCLAIVFAAVAFHADAVPVASATLAKNGGDPVLEFARDGDAAYLRIGGEGRRADGETCLVTAPASGWARLDENDTPDAHRYATASFFAEIAPGCVLTVHRLGERHAVVEAPAGCATAFGAACPGLRFDGVFGPGDEHLQGANASPQPELEEAYRRADADLNATWKRLKPLLGADDNVLLGEQRAWVANKEKGCKAFAFAPSRLACATAMTVARTEVLDDVLAMRRADREHIAALGIRAVPPNDPLHAAALATIAAALRPRLHADVTLVDADLRAGGDWIAVTAKPRTANGTKPDFAATEWAEAAASGALEDGVHALLRRGAAKSGPELVEVAVGPTDVYWEGWVERHGVPEALFPAR